MKRIIAAILVLTMTLAFAGCAKAPKEQATVPATENVATEAPEAIETTLATEPLETEEATEPGPIALELGVAVEAGVWEYTLIDIQFAREVGNYSEYENYLVPGGKASNSNPFALEDDETLAVVTYKLRMTGKEKQRPCNTKDGTAAGTGKFIYGDGFVFDSATDGKRPQANYFDGNSFNSMSFFSLEPLSDEIECRVAFALPLKTIEDESEPLTYEVAFNELGNNLTFTYTIR